MNNFRPPAVYPFSKAWPALVGAAGLLLVAGCTTPQQPEPAETAAELAPQEETAEPAPGQKPKPRPRPKPAPVTPEPPAEELAEAPVPEATPVEPVPNGPGRLTIRIESVPPGAMIVIDGRPLGRTPVEIEVGSANNGFFKDPVTIRARFVASDAASESVSVDEQLGPLERVPLALVFSREGVQRILRQH